MKALLLCALALYCSVQAAQCCSCHPDAFLKSRPTAIRDDFCFRYCSCMISLHIALIIYIAIYVYVYT